MFEFNPTVELVIAPVPTATIEQLFRIDYMQLDDGSLLLLDDGQPLYLED